MKTKEQIQAKIEEVRQNENECDWMAECIVTGTHPSKYPFKFETFHDIDAAYELDAEAWTEKSIVYFRIAEALEWVLKD